MQCFAVFSVELTKVFALLICALNTATNLAPGPAYCYLNVRNTYVIDCLPRMVTQTRGEKKKTNAQIMSRLSSLPRFSGVQLNYNQKAFVKVRGKQTWDVTSKTRSASGKFTRKPGECRKRWKDLRRRTKEKVSYITRHLQRGESTLTASEIPFQKYIHFKKISFQVVFAAV